MSDNPLWQKIPARWLHILGVETDQLAERTAGAGVTIDGLLVKDGLVSADFLALATVAVANATGGATGAALTLDLYRLDGTTRLASARQVLIVWYGTAYAPSAANITTVTLGTATKGSIIAQGNSWALVQTDANGEFDCTATDSADETLYFAVRTPPSGVSDVTKACVVVGSNSDSAAWSA